MSDGGTWANPPPGNVLLSDDSGTRWLVRRDERVERLIAEAEASMGDVTIEGAVFYSVEGGEVGDLSARTPAEAIDAYPIDAYPITLVGYAREVVPPEWVEKWARIVAGDALERAADEWGEEYGDPDGYHEPFTAEAEAKCIAAIEAAVKELYAGGEVWRCREVGRRELSAEQVRAIVEGER